MFFKYMLFCGNKFFLLDEQQASSYEMYILQNVKIRYQIQSCCEHKKEDNSVISAKSANLCPILYLSQTHFSRQCFGWLAWAACIKECMSFLILLHVFDFDIILTVDVHKQKLIFVVITKEEKKLLFFKANRSFFENSQRKEFN